MSASLGARGSAPAIASRSGPPSTSAMTYEYGAAVRGSTESLPAVYEIASDDRVAVAVPARLAAGNVSVFASAKISLGLCQRVDDVEVLVDIDEGRWKARRTVKGVQIPARGRMSRRRRLLARRAILSRSARLRGSRSGGAPVAAAEPAGSDRLGRRRAGGWDRHQAAAMMATPSQDGKESLVHLLSSEWV